MNRAVRIVKITSNVLKLNLYSFEDIARLIFPYQPHIKVKRNNWYKQKPSLDENINIVVSTTAAVVFKYMLHTTILWKKFRVNVGGVIKLHTSSTSTLTISPNYLLATYLLTYLTTYLLTYLLKH